MYTSHEKFEQISDTTHLNADQDKVVIEDNWWD